MQTVTRPTAHIDQDAYRFIFAAIEKPGDVRREMIVGDILIALRHGYDVILDGILSAKGYQSAFDQLLHEHPKNNFAFYLETSFDETVRRHAMRPKANDFGSDDMAQWYGLADPLHIENEVIIPESSSLEESITTIRQVSGI